MPNGIQTDVGGSLERHFIESAAITYSHRTSINDVIDFHTITSKKIYEMRRRKPLNPPYHEDRLLMTDLDLFETFLSSVSYLSVPYCMLRHFLLN